MSLNQNNNISQEIIDRMSFLGKVIDDLHSKLEIHEKEYSMEDTNEDRKEQILLQQNAIRKVINEYNIEQKVMVFANGI